MKVKICGIQTLEHARAAEQAGADALGFMFAESKRRITPTLAKNIISKLSNECWKVGVFVNERVEIVKNIVQHCGLTAIQLHGDEQPIDYLEVGVPIIKSISITSTTNTDIEIQQIEYADYFLLDTASTGYRGGNGIPFDWKKARNIGSKHPNIILAGGLKPENVNRAIEVVSPYMVDVSSGVEVNGAKSTRKIFEFIKMAKEGAIR